MNGDTKSFLEDSLIDVRNVVKRFKDTIAVNNLSLQIQKGEFVALLGPNGAGKTTLIEMLEGIQKPDAGSISILGTTWKESETFLRSKVGLALQETRFMDRITVRETLNLFGTFYKSKKQRLSEILELINLEEKQNTYVNNLSGGQRQRLALGVSILNYPEILFLDEPTTGLDPGARRDVWKILNRLRQDKTTMILTTHYMEEAEILCEKIIIMDHGKILDQGTLTDLLGRSDSGEIIRFSMEDGSNPENLVPSEGMYKFFWDPAKSEARIHVSAITDYLPELIRTISVSGKKLNTLECHKTTLDDLFLNMTGRGLEE
ncbi:ABC transporter ATP-binding protein [Leptospira mayottensis]|uniref:ABC transporter, ATP-binding protein n=2 Tax=Leptospira mayottensis TaxID=1137606 RepID=A0AA87MNR8_9LEPT|nr:ABC transporter ATP-binding protein [Leptospira mayottensis]AXR60059.1 ABC transporter ATP-binding protein [Leptospira mayottensis]AXR63688.1 ABC transporter ATP-binding protein [Leptospira mayottensis]AZQ03519.1 ABC transporter ATP-binding protein [Leptospira mayottensis 200901116]EKR99052.1 ABC transporter, ATP-binding protein [Leptospira mayottensis 200901122]TGM99037.1 ABC transporter ATP-binding protein [Leptospira mayottensis]